MQWHIQLDAQGSEHTACVVQQCLQMYCLQMDEKQQWIQIWRVS